MVTLVVDRVERDLRELEGRAMDSHTVRHEVLARLRRAVPVDAYCFAEVDPGSRMMVAHATDPTGSITCVIPRSSVAG